MPLTDKAGVQRAQHAADVQPQDLATPHRKAARPFQPLHDRINRCTRPQKLQPQIARANQPLIPRKIGHQGLQSEPFEGQIAAHRQALAPVDHELAADLAVIGLGAGQIKDRAGPINRQKQRGGAKGCKAKIDAISLQRHLGIQRRQGRDINALLRPALGLHPAARTAAALPQRRLQVERASHHLGHQLGPVLALGQIGIDRQHRLIQPQRAPAQMHRSGIGQREPALNRDTARPQALRQIRCRRARQGGDLGQPAQIGLHIALGRHRLPARLPLKAARRLARLKGQRHRAQFAIQKGAELAQGQIGGKGLSLQHSRQHHLHRTFKVRDRGFHGQILQIDPRARAMINKHQPPPRHRGATERKGRAHTRRCRADRPAAFAAKDPILPPIAGALQKELRRHSGHSGDLGLPADQRRHIHGNL